jgi:hypothetical protein
MESPYTLPEIITHTQESVNRFRQAALQVDSDRFFPAPAPGKWSPAQHVQHLCTALKTSTAAYVLPLWLVRLVGGRPKQASGTYLQLVELYQQQLQAGGRASGRYIPREIPAEKGQENLVGRFEGAASGYLTALRRFHREEPLDQYQVAHPILKKITLRELAFFNSYHILHHLPGLQ